jgi:hypothetical protein
MATSANTYSTMLVCRPTVSFYSVPRSGARVTSVTGMLAIIDTEQAGADLDRMRVLCADLAGAAGPARWWTMRGRRHYWWLA